MATVPASDALIAQVRDAQVQILTYDKNYNEAYQIAAMAAAAPGRDAGDFSRLGDVYAGDEAERRSRRCLRPGARPRAGQAEPRYGRCFCSAPVRSRTRPLARGQASARAGLAIAPDQPLLLNFLGYAKLERGEDMDKAEAMIRKASDLAPDDASIIDSLGWAEFKRGKTDEAIDTLQRQPTRIPSKPKSRSILATPFIRPGGVMRRATRGTRR